MIYQDIHAARFLARPNRFIAQVELEGRVETVHVKNTGRCKELLLPGCTVYLEGSSNPARRTKYDLVAVEKVRPGLPPLFINMDSQAPNKVFAEWMTVGLGEALGFPRPTLLRPETTWGNSRFDFYIEDGLRRIFMEVKGVTLEENGIVRFPDAPTERGVKHIQELIECKKAGYEAYIFFVIQMKDVLFMEPNDRTHPAFGEALRKAAKEGVGIFARDCLVKPDELTIDQEVEVRL